MLKIKFVDLKSENVTKIRESLGKFANILQIEKWNNSSPIRN